jgi:hypothetical protein
MLLQERHLAAAFCLALRLMFRALIEVAESPLVLARRVEKEDVNLMMSDPYRLLLPELMHCAAAKYAQLIEIDRAI